MLIRNDIERLNILFKNWVGQKILDFKIILLLNSKIEVHFLVEQKMNIEKLFSEYKELESLNNIVTFYQVEFEEEEDKEWFKGDKIDMGLRRRLNNLIQHNDKQIKKPCPILTFYSYKGGTGRTTSLAFFASWLATHHSKKVVVIDCDFEAPGLTNYFDISEDRKGVAEYFLDSEYAISKGETLDIKKDYSHQIRYEYVGKGDIFIVPAGNLSNDPVNENTTRTYRSDYLESIARLDITSVNHIIEQFESLFLDLQRQIGLDYNNSVILIDSRTGFNDTFAVLATLSDIIVGFFGINKQSQVGLTQFLENFGTVENTRNKQIVLVNSISETRNHELIFKEIINDYIIQNEDKFIDEDLGRKDFISNVFRIPRREFLGKLGTSLESDDRGILSSNASINKELINLEFYEKVQDPDSEFKQFFNGLYEKIEFLLNSDEYSDNEQEEYENTEVLDQTRTSDIQIDDLFFSEIKYKVDKTIIRERVLRTLILPENFPKPYADTGKEKPKLNDFFFRDCMKDLFNRDKFVIIGYKGTGKTHIYRAFENDEITKVLCKREGQNSNNYIFVNVIPISDNIKYFSTDLNFQEEEKKKVGADYFFKSFWLIYSWSAIFQNLEIKNLKFNTSFSVFDISEKNISLILDIISNRQKIDLINKDLETLDNLLKEKNKIIILSYDQIDFVVKPSNWNEGVAPLINYWRNNSFSKIYPKIFVRADVFVDRLTNVTNFNEIQQEKSISLQWSKQELFAYFFKYVFKICKVDFFSLSYAYRDYSEASKLMLLQIEKESSLDNERQIPIHKEDFLKFLVENFFGKYANRYDKRNNYGDTYDWFYSNLADAKGAISIRPFLDLLQNAIGLALSPKQLEYTKEVPKRSNQILSSFYYTSHQAKAHAAERYYSDLAKDKGNEPLRFFFQYIKNDGLERFRIYEFSREQLDDLIKRIIDFPNYKNEESLKDKSIDDFKNLLINNGILGVTHITNRQLTRYIIPFLYRSYFGVGKPNKPVIKLLENVNANKSIPPK